jgi:hypothetical protein
VPLFLPLRFISMNLMSQTKVCASFIQICGWRALHCNSLLIFVARRTSSQHRSSRGWTYRSFYTYNHTPLDGSTKEVIFVSANSASCPIASSPSTMRYCVMSLPLNFMMFFREKCIYRNIMVYMILGIIVLLLLWTRNCTQYPM